MDITIVMIAAVILAALAASVKVPAVIPVATVSAAMESLVTNVAATAKPSVNVNC